MLPSLATRCVSQNFYYEHPALTVALATESLCPGSRPSTVKFGLQGASRKGRDGVCLRIVREDASSCEGSTHRGDSEGRPDVESGCAGLLHEDGEGGEVQARDVVASCRTTFERRVSGDMIACAFHSTALAKKTRIELKPKVTQGDGAQGTCFLSRPVTCMISALRSGSGAIPDLASRPSRRF